MTKKPFEPNFKTPKEQLCKEEINKLNSGGYVGSLAKDIRDDSQPDMVWESEQIAKSCGIYLEYNRAVTGKEKDWMYMVRICNPGGGPITRGQWNVFDEISEEYTRDREGHASLRLTTRQNIQFHWIRKENLVGLIKRLAEQGNFGLNGCGDNMRNVMGCPASRFSDIFNAHEWAQKVGEYFQLPLGPFIQIFAMDPKYIRQPESSFEYGPSLLNRKFKIAFSAVHKDPLTDKFIFDNCVELRTNDLAVVPIIENGNVTKFQIYVGGGQGERNGKPSLATLGLPFCQTEKSQLMSVLDAVVRVHQEWGDRQNRFWARVKYVVKKMGIEWYRDQVSTMLGYPLEKPELTLDYGNRQLHLGWWQQPTNGLWSYGAFIENGRITDASPNGKLKTMVREIVNKYPVDLMVTPNQDLLFTNIPGGAKKDFEAELKRWGYGLRHSKAYSPLRLASGACVGRDTCRLTYTDSEKFEPFLIDELEQMGWGDLAESIGVTGCERQCFRPATKTIGLIGSGMDRYQFKLMGTEDAKHQGVPIIAGDGKDMYLRSIPKDKVSTVIDALFRFYKNNAQSNEGMGSYHHRIGMEAIIQHLKSNPATKGLMDKPFNTDCIIA